MIQVRVHLRSMAFRINSRSAQCIPSNFDDGTSKVFRMKSKNFTFITFRCLIKWFICHLVSVEEPFFSLYRCGFFRMNCMYQRRDKFLLHCALSFPSIYTIQIILLKFVKRRYNFTDTSKYQLTIIMRLKKWYQSWYLSKEYTVPHTSKNDICTYIYKNGNSLSKRDFRSREKSIYGESFYICAKSLRAIAIYAVPFGIVASYLWKYWWLRKKVSLVLLQNKSTISGNTRGRNRTRKINFFILLNAD